VVGVQVFGEANNSQLLPDTFPETETHCTHAGELRQHDEDIGGLPRIRLFAQLPKIACEEELSSASSAPFAGGLSESVADDAIAGAVVDEAAFIACRYSGNAQETRLPLPSLHFP
jgi:hypothetical protein